MAKAMNFKNNKKSFWSVTLADGTVLLLSTPTKAIFDALTELKNDISDSDGGETLDRLYSACATILSRNKTGKVITEEYVAENLDIEDIITLFTGYMEFVNEIKASKN